MKIQSWKTLQKQTKKTKVRTEDELLRSYRFVPPRTAWYRLVPDKNFSPSQFVKKKVMRDCGVGWHSHQPLWKLDFLAGEPHFAGRTDNLVPS
jgi:hypothetical protein